MFLNDHDHDHDLTVLNNNSEDVRISEGSGAASNVRSTCALLYLLYIFFHLYMTPAHLAANPPHAKYSHC